MTTATQSRINATRCPNLNSLILLVLLSRNIVVQYCCLEMPCLKISDYIWVIFVNFCKSDRYLMSSMRGNCSVRRLSDALVALDIMFIPIASPVVHLKRR